MPVVYVLNTGSPPPPPLMTPPPLPPLPVPVYFATAARARANMFFVMSCVHEMPVPPHGAYPAESNRIFAARALTFGSFRFHDLNLGFAFGRTLICQNP